MIVQNFSIELKKFGQFELTDCKLEKLTRLDRQKIRNNKIGAAIFFSSLLETFRVFRLLSLDRNKGFAFHVLVGIISIY